MLSKVTSVISEKQTSLSDDEIHTPDSSRYFYSDGYSERQIKNEHNEGDRVVM